MSDDNISEKHHASTHEALRRIQTAESVLLPIPRDAFEKLYLTPKMPTAGNLRRTFGNPTPISLLGFLLASTPNSMQTMGWRGSKRSVFIFFGGMVQILGAIGEWILGNTFSCALFFTYGTFWIVEGTNQMPSFGVGTNYSPTGDTLKGVETPEFYATTGLYFVILALVTFVYLICSIRTNVCLFSALFLLVITFALNAGSFFQMALENPEGAAKLKMAAGAFNFALCIPVWIIFIAQIADAVDFPIAVPVGDLSTFVLGRAQKARRQEELNRQSTN